MRTLNVDLGKRSYPIRIGSGLLNKADTFADLIKDRQIMLVTNETLEGLYLQPLMNTLTEYQIDTTILEDGEQYKNLQSFDLIMSHLLTQKHHRQTTLVALGGGVVGDLTGFAAACYQRGVSFVQVPTTLLAMVDSSVGGKTAVNHRLGKNMIGAFHQPTGVVADLDVLKTLPDREWSAGMAEVIKYGLIRDPAFLLWIENHLSEIKAQESEALATLVQRSCLCKARVVEEDETENGVRAILNLGHTFGHAIEAWCGYRDWLHGEAVAVGMVMAADLSVRLGWLEESEKDRLTRLLSQFDLPVRPPANMSPEDFMKFMALDKKVQSGALRLVLLQGIGKAVVTADFDSDKLAETLLEFAST